VLAGLLLLPSDLYLNPQKLRPVLMQCWLQRERSTCCQGTPTPLQLQHSACRSHPRQQQHHEQSCCP